MANTLFVRRPPVRTIAQRMMAMAPMVPYLQPASMLHFGEIARAVWAYLDLTRQTDVSQPVNDQLRLAGIENAMRNLARNCLRDYNNATGSLQVQLTQDAHSALDQMVQYDIRFAPTFDVENTILRIMAGMRVV